MVARIDCIRGAHERANKDDDGTHDRNRENRDPIALI
jgi:hypothetical protein